MKYYLINILIFFTFISCGNSSKEDHWFKVLESRDLDLIKKEFKPKYINLVNKDRDNSSMFALKYYLEYYGIRTTEYIDNTDFEILEYLFNNGVDPNFINEKSNTTIMDYLIKEMKHGSLGEYFIFLSNYKAKRECELKRKKCKFKRISRSNSLERISFYLFYDESLSGLLRFIDLTSKELKNDVFIEIFKAGRYDKTKKRINILKELILLYQFMINYMDEDKKTILDYSLNGYSDSFIHFLRKHGAKRGCELLNKKCEREIE